MCYTSTRPSVSRDHGCELVWDFSVFVTESTVAVETHSRETVSVTQIAFEVCLNLCRDLVVFPPGSPLFNSGLTGSVQPVQGQLYSKLGLSTKSEG